MGELRNGRGDLEALAEDNLLALEANIFGPLHEAGEVLLGLDVLTCRTDTLVSERNEHEWQSGLTDAEVLGARLEEGVLLNLRGALVCAVGGRGGLLGSFRGLGLVIETSLSARLYAAWKAAAVAVHPEL